MEWKRRLMIVGIVIGVYAGIRWLLPVTVPFLFGWFLACWIYPLAVKTERRVHMKRSVAGFIYMLGLLALLGAGLYKAGEVLLRQLKLAVASYHGLEAWGMKALNQCCRVLENWTGIQAAVSRKYFLNQVSHMQTALLNDLSPASMLDALSSLKWILELASTVAVIFISGMLFLKDMEALRRNARNSLWLRGPLRISRRLKETVVVYLKSQGIIMLIIAAMCTAGFWLMKSPYYLLLGLLLGALDALPVIEIGRAHV